MLEKGKSNIKSKKVQCGKLKPSPLAKKMEMACTCATNGSYSTCKNSPKMDSREEMGATKNNMGGGGRYWESQRVLVFDGRAPFDQPKTERLGETLAGHSGDEWVIVSNLKHQAWTPAWLWQSFGARIPLTMKFIYLMKCTEVVVPVKTLIFKWHCTCKYTRKRFTVK